MRPSRKFTVKFAVPCQSTVNAFLYYSKSPKAWKIPVSMTLNDLRPNPVIVPCWSFRRKMDIRGRDQDANRFEILRRALPLYCLSACGCTGCLKQPVTIIMYQYIICCYHVQRQALF